MARKGIYRPFPEARAFVHSLGLKSRDEWREWLKTGACPADIPNAPEHVYPESWRGTGDWLGTGRVADQDRIFRPFPEARAFARSLGLRSKGEWREWRKIGAWPADIPSSPERTYRESWRGWRDWLGNENRPRINNWELGMMLTHFAAAWSQTTHAKLKADPALWWRFHELFAKSRRRWPEEPIEHVAGLIRGDAADLRVADLGCGQCLLRDALPEYEITGVDHVGFDASVVEADMASTPLADSSFDVAVLCLSLLGHNWADYLLEARRILRPGGRLLIVESFPGRWERMQIPAVLEAERFTGVRVEKRRFSANRKAGGFLGFVYVSARKERFWTQHA